MESNPLSGKVALVTGASSGIGADIAVMLGKLGMRIALVARRKDRLDQVALRIADVGGHALSLPTDLRDDEAIRSAVRRTVAELGPVAVLVNSAGVADAMRPVHELDVELWDAEFTINLRAPALLCRLLLPEMRRNDAGFIVNICSEAGVSIIPGMGAYCVSKHGLRVLTELIDKENDQFGVKAWAICPGEVATDMADWDHGISDRFLRTEDLTGVIQLLLCQDHNVKMGPEILIRTMKNPFEGMPREKDGSWPTS